ncbi:MAG: adenylate/guanylate cyclase domain-containing protein [Myxococcales bacterium]
MNEAQLGARLAAIRSASPTIVGRLASLVRERPDDEVAQIRPFELARTWGADRRDVLRSFLRATEAGVLDLSWQVNCPQCKVGARIVQGLAELSPTAHCAACEVDFEIDFARHVEAVFCCNPAVREVSPTLWCASSPAFLLHVWGQLRPAAGATVERTLRLPKGELLLRTLWVRRTQTVTLPEGGPPEVLKVVIEADRLEIQAQSKASGPETKLVVENRTGDEAALLIERTGWSADAVLGTTIASLPEFSSLFATEAPARGVELKVGSVALLFSDLTGSTALYERVGDAKAFALVEDHFRVAEKAVEAHGGALVKTMGDAVMASFPSLSQAVSAGLQMVRDHDARFASERVGVKVGVHAGPCMAVRANGRLDYFGTTVNVSARLQGEAHASEVVLMEASAQDPTVRGLLERERLRPFSARLKGIQEEQRLVAVELGGDAMG